MAIARLAGRIAARCAAVLVPALLLASLSPPATAAGVPVYRYEVVHVYPHDPEAFTEGLFYLGGFLYESTGLEGHSVVRKVDLATGRVLQQVALAPNYFGEGIVNWKDRIVGLTWRDGVGFVYDRATLKVRSRFSYPGEGWALTQDGQHLIMSDGTPELRFLDPETLAEVRRLTVTYNGAPVRYLNELEWVRGEIYANLWQTNLIARIAPESGVVTGVIDLSGLLAPGDIVRGHTDVLNGIAYDAAHDRLFVTGKNWPKLFEIRLRAPEGTPSPPARP